MTKRHQIKIKFTITCCEYSLVQVQWLRVSVSCFVDMASDRSVQIISETMLCCFHLYTLCDFIGIYWGLLSTVLGEMGTCDGTGKTKKKETHSAQELLISESVMLYFSWRYGHLAMILQSPGCSTFTNWTRDVFIVIAEKSLVLSCWKFSDFVFEKYIQRSGWNVELFTYHTEFTTLWVSWN